VFVSESPSPRAVSSRSGWLVLVAALALGLSVQPAAAIGPGVAGPPSPGAISRVTSSLPSAATIAGVVTVTRRMPASASAWVASGGADTASAASAGHSSSTSPAGSPVAPAVAPSPMPPFAVTPAHQLIRMGAVGDSITAFTDRAGNVTPWSWVRTAAIGDVVDAGGYRQYGDDTAQILAGTTPLNADAVVVMAGTNDILDGSDPVPTSQTLANITAIVSKAGGRIHVLSALAPKDNAGAAATLTLNAALSELASRSGWVWVDPWTTLRDADGHWVTGATVDGVHPTAASGAVAGEAIRTAVLTAIGSE
jgi:hypothetical protein